MAIDYKKEGQIAAVTIDRPQKMNCLSLADLTELGRVWLDFRDDDRLSVATVTGAGETAFCTGADLKDLIPRVNSGELRLPPTIPGFLKNICCYKPIIAAVNGMCLAGGMELLLGTDIRIAAPEAVFGLPEVKLGLFPTAGSTVRLPRQIPYCRAMEILLVGDMIGAREALSVGLINRVVPRGELQNTVASLARRICENGPLAVKAIKESVLVTDGIPENQAYYVEAHLAGRVFGTDDATEGPRAFLEGRKPVYTGK
jgi:enoyl-CoA hydratase